MAVIEVKAEVAGLVWKIVAAPGQDIGEDDTVIILESMKMEIPVASPRRGTVTEIVVAEGSAVAEGEIVARIQV